MLYIENEIKPFIVKIVCDGMTQYLSNHLLMAVFAAILLVIYFIDTTFSPETRIGINQHFHFYIIRSFLGRCAV
jgi:hypothetical protein